MESLSKTAAHVVGGFVFMAPPPTEDRVPSLVERTRAETRPRFLHLLQLSCKNDPMQEAAGYVSALTPTDLFKAVAFVRAVVNLYVRRMCVGTLGRRHDVLAPFRSRNISFWNTSSIPVPPLLLRSSTGRERLPPGHSCISRRSML